mmetsp:Transcript_14363/g.17219  ORF Transcript_14363/g.17219 Transcript_14363/m.17219 type:complete len:90 (-) Transcript_14363:315-584(-)
MDNRYVLFLYKFSMMEIFDSIFFLEENPMNLSLDVQIFYVTLTLSLFSYDYVLMCILLNVYKFYIVTVIQVENNLKSLRPKKLKTALAV